MRRLLKPLFTSIGIMCSFFIFAVLMSSSDKVDSTDNIDSTNGNSLELIGNYQHMRVFRLNLHNTARIIVYDVKTGYNSISK